MPKRVLRLSEVATRRLRRVLVGPQGLSILSGIMLGGYWFGGEGLLLFAGLAVPAILAAASIVTAPGGRAVQADGLTGLPLRQAALAALETALDEAPKRGRAVACFLVEIDGFAEFRRSNDNEVVDEVLVRVAERLRGTVRDDDTVARIGEATFSVVPSSLRHADLETCIQMASRMQAAVAEAVGVRSARYYVTASVGFVLPRQIEEATAGAMFDAAESALVEAQRQGPGSIRAFSSQLARHRVVPSRLVAEVAAALENGQIQAWFQPQLSTDTGKVVGFEALARWQHPVHGAIAPSEFLPAVEAAGCSARLGQVVLSQALSALHRWSEAGLDVPTVSINLDEIALRDPTLPERIKWELDRFELAPERLCIEVLETVILPSGDDIITRNIAALAELGVGIDLDDFGTGTASIAAIRSFAVDRIKIDRSFVTRIDLDRGQQDMVAAILSMAERLALSTLAEGVETVGEHAMLAQLGCSAVQGFGISAPLPFDETAEWIRRHEEKIADTPQLGRQAM